MDVSTAPSDPATSCPVVWLQLSGYYPSWPHRVEKEGEETVYVAFGDNSSCDGARKIQPYNCDQVADMISKGKAKLRHRPETLKQFCEAIQEAEKYIRENLDPSYSFPSTKEVQLTPLSLHSSVFTLGSDSASSPGHRETPQGDSPMGKPRRKVTNGSKRRRAAQTLSNMNGDPGGSESEDTTPVRKRIRKMDGKGDERRRSSAKSQPRRLATTTPTPPTSAVEDPLQSELPLTVESTGKKLVEVKEGLRLHEGYVKTDPLAVEVLTEVGGERGGAEVATPRVTESGSSSGGKREGRKEPGPAAATPPTRSTRSSSADLSAVPSTTTTPTSSTTPVVVTQAAPTASPSVEAAHIPAPVMTTASRPSPFSSDSEGHLDHDLRSSDDDDDLPSVDVKGDSQETLKIHQLSKKDVVWVKYKIHPFWPALIASVKTPKKQKHKAIARVYFFGCSDDKTISIRRSQNIAPFKQQEKFMMAGHKFHQFQQAVREAHDFIQDSAEGKFSGCTPREIIKQLELTRPKPSRELEKVLSLSPCSSSSEEEGEGEEEEREREDSMSSSNELSDREEEAAVDENCSASFPYTYDRVVQEIENMKDVLEGVVKGEVESSFHTIYTTGSQKKKEKLKLVSRGPIKNWPSTKANQLLEEVLLKIAESQSQGFRYTLNVLLPEAMVRVKEKVENLSREQALAFL